MKRVVCILSAIIMAVCIAACENKYNAEIYDDARKWIREEFAENNQVWAYYEEDERLPEEYPSARSFLVKDEQEFGKIFVEKPQGLEVNFQNEMLLVYTFNSVYIRKMKIDTVRIDEDTLTVYLEYDKVKHGVGDAVQIYQRWVVVKMDKVGVERLEMDILK